MGLKNVINLLKGWLEVLSRYTFRSILLLLSWLYASCIMGVLPVGYCYVKNSQVVLSSSLNNWFVVLWDFVK